MVRLIQIFSLVAIISLAQIQNTSARELLDQVVAVVNDEAITQSELDSVLRPVYEDFKAQFSGQELMRELNDARQKILSQLIEDRLVYQEAIEQGIEVTEDEIEEDMSGFRESFETDRQMQAALKGQGLSMKKLRERIKKQIMIRRLHDFEIRSKVLVSPLELEKYYEENKKEYSGQVKVRVRSITIKKSPEAREKGLLDETAKGVIENIQAKLAQGGDFAELAEGHSEDTHAEAGGLGEWLEDGSMIPVINDVIFSKKVGEVTEIIETPLGYHLFKIEERKDGKAQSFDEVRDQIHNQLYREKTLKRFNEWMSELKKKSYISIR